MNYAYLTAPVPTGMDADLLNVFRLLDHGINLEMPVSDNMNDALYNALSFAHANDVHAFDATPEAAQAAAEVHA